MLEVVLPEGLKHLGSYVFAGCSDLKKINIPSGVKELWEGVLSDTAIEELIIPEGLNRITGDAFYGARELSYLSLPSTLYYLDSRSLRIGQGSKLKGHGIIMSEENPSYKVKDGALYDIYEKTLIYVIVTEDGSYELPKSVETIYSESFRDTSNLQKVKLNEYIKVIPKDLFKDSSLNEIILPKSLEVIESNGFANSELRSIEFPDGLKIIDDYAFHNVEIDDVILPSSIEYLGYYAFHHELAHRRIVMKGKEVPHIYQLGEDNTQDGTFFSFYVPKQQYACYKSMIERNQKKLSYKVVAVDDIASIHSSEALNEWIDRNTKEQGQNQVISQRLKNFLNTQLTIKNIVTYEDYIYYLSDKIDNTGYILKAIEWINPEKTKLELKEKGIHVLSIPHIIKDNGQEYEIIGIAKDFEYPEEMDKLILEEGIELIQKQALSIVHTEYLEIPSSMKYIASYIFDQERGMVTISFVGKVAPYIERQANNSVDGGAMFRIIVAEGYEELYEDAMECNNPVHKILYTVN